MDHVEYKDLSGIKIGERALAEVSPPGEVVSGNVADNGGWPWRGGPASFRATVPAEYSGNHSSFFKGKYLINGKGKGTLNGKPIHYLWEMYVAASNDNKIIFCEAHHKYLDHAEYRFWGHARTNVEAETFSIVLYLITQAALSTDNFLVKACNSLLCDRKIFAPNVDAIKDKKESHLWKYYGNNTKSDQVEADMTTEMMTFAPYYIGYAKANATFADSEPDEKISLLKMLKFSGEWKSVYIRDIVQPKCDHWLPFNETIY